MNAYVQRLRTRAVRDESGFTLAELIIASAISFVLAGALAGAVIIGLRTTTTSSQRFSGTKDMQLIQGSLPRDVLSATGVQLNVASGAANSCSGLATLLRLTWQTPGPPTTVASGGPPTATLTSYEVDYVYSVNAVTGTDTPTGSLTRMYYSGTPGSCTLVANRVLANQLSANAAAQTAVYASPNVSLNLTDVACARYSVSATTRSATTTTTAVPTTTAAPVC